MNGSAVYNILASLLFALNVMLFDAHAQIFPVATNHWTLSSEEEMDRVAFVMASSIDVRGKTHDDSFWLAADHIALGGIFGNDVWAIGANVRLEGNFADHARVLAQNVHVDGVISNGLWAAARSVSIATNSILQGEQFILTDNLTLQGKIEGDVLARAKSITLGGTIVGNVRIFGDDIIIRPGTTIIGDLLYVTTNRSIVLDANSHVSGVLRKYQPPAQVSRALPTEWNALLQLYFFAAAVLVGLPFILLFPGINGHSVRNLRLGLLKCGLAGLLYFFGIPFLIFGLAITVIGIPFALVLSAAYALIIYLGKFPMALLIGSALLNRRGNISIPVAILSLVAGLFLYYSIGMVPYMGSSLQTTVSAFGAGSLLVALFAGRGKIRTETTESQP
ncbi:MAG TPA: hypothetical protein PJ991_10205 [Kiritimatiellia bacterium]|nr:hypothetical protein [Kiritimatiellia bacterium]